ncbi:hypothetical protein PDR5_14880 [Pseudomonas sp. DR 5-09]|nr:hypothetical protein PDR5_14880 [Pseudomonas sp. DR 5-09]
MSGDHGRVGQAGDADGHVEAAAHRIDLLVAEHQLQFDVRVLLMEQRNQLAQPSQAERHRRVDPQYPAQFTHPVPRPLFGLVQCRNHFPRRFEILGPGLGQVQAAGGALQQLHADGLFQCLNLFADFRAGHVHGPGGGCKAVLADRHHEGAHAFDAIHDCPYFRINDSRFYGIVPLSASP